MYERLFFNGHGRSKKNSMKYTILKRCIACLDHVSNVRNSNKLLRILN